MSRVERFFERLVERPSARLFGTRLQPIQILRRIERAMDADRGAEGRRGLVPDQFTVRLHPEDLAALLPAEEVASELASGALSFARSHGYALRERPRVILRPDPRRRPGEVEIETAVSSEPEVARAAPGADSSTRIFEVPVVRAPAGLLQVHEPGKPARRIPMAGAVESLNVSVAAAVCLYEAHRQRRVAAD